MKLTKNQTILCDNLGYKFVSPRLLLDALTHSSLNSRNKVDNQRLEFLGDRVLALIISDELIKLDPMAREGQLAPRLNVLVKKETCAAIALKIGVGTALLMGKSEMRSGGRQKIAILGDAMEAVIASIYIDGGLDQARKSVLKVWYEHIKNAPEASFESKSYLQEWVQAQGMPPPIYEEMRRIGPDHAPVFNIRVILENGKTATGVASSKRAAEQQAARNLLLNLRESIQKTPDDMGLIKKVATAK